MKKIFLSVVFMLAAVTINAEGRLGDSVIFHYTTDELYNMMVADREFQNKVAEEIQELMWNYNPQYDNWGNMIIDNKFFEVLKAGNMLQVIDFLKQLKAEQDANDAANAFDNAFDNDLDD